MNVYPELARIVGAYSKASRLIDKLKDKIDCDGLIFEGAYLIVGS